ncbi:hypothetical protein [Paenibacillus piscarius]|uniref:hypothetical protein n=1 Tax=Paenibacillus piscarius TaxID=1089681 RepID=UPI001EE84019|nr:hypothetical protein [Paenibacillus piscarius]
MGKELGGGPGYDELSVEVTVDVSKKYINVSKHKRVLTPVINETVILYVNEVRLNEDADEVFVVTEFFESLMQQGQLPMYTCSCGIFGCGGFYVHVSYKDQGVMWETEQSAYRKFMFTRENVRCVAQKLIKELSALNDLRTASGLQTYHNLDSYRAKLDGFINY